MDNRDLNDRDLHPDDLTWRERDILILLSERLTNREIANRLHLAESTVKDYVGKILSKLYVKNRRQAVERARELGIFDVDQRTAASPPTNLPASPTPFIGRKSELEGIKQQLKTTRLFTLTGPGGMGKTRLALKIAEVVADDFQDGSFFVPLAPIHSVDHIIQPIAEAVNFSLPTHENPKHQLLRYLKKRNLLLVMDNFEHLLDGVSIVSEILQAASGVKILATSREKLNLQSETNINIGGMEIYSGNRLENTDENDAITLFLQSATKVLPEFNASPSELTQIADICQFVQGMPLAIELAASWLHVLSVNEIEDELNMGLDILTTEVRDTPERHRSIRAVFDSSWTLLDQTEQEICMHLSAFRGGFTRDAAQQVAGASITILSGLVNRSILTHNLNSNRFEIHELLRQYAQEQLYESQQVKGAVEEAYAAYYADFMDERWQQLRGDRQLPALFEIEADIENVRTAWRYYLDKKNALQIQKFIHGLWIVYWGRGWAHAAIELFEDAVKALSNVVGELEDVTAVRATAMANQGFFTSWVGLPDQGYILAKESIEILQQVNYPIGLAFAFNSLTLAAFYLNRPDEERDAAQKFLEIAKAINDKWFLAFGLWLTSLAEFRNKNYPESKKLAKASLSTSEEINDTIGSSWCFMHLGQIAIMEGEIEKAENYIMSCLQLSSQSNFLWQMGNATKYLGQVTLLKNDNDKAQEYFVQSLKIAYDLGMERDIANHLYDFASLRVSQDRPYVGVELLSYLLQRPASHHARLGGGRIRDKAKALLAELENKLPQKVYAAALKRGRLFKLDNIVSELLSSKK